MDILSKALQSQLNRRAFVRAGVRTTSALSAAAMFPSTMIALTKNDVSNSTFILDPAVKALVERGIDEARTAGATYADVRLSFTRRRLFGNGSLPSEVELLHAGVRALVNGYWGVASSPIWKTEEITRLAREAVRQAQVNAVGTARPIDWQPLDQVANGHWETPVKRDAFQVHPIEIRDYLLGLREKLYNELGRLNPYGDKGRSPNATVMFTASILEKAFGSSDGAYCTQRIHRSAGSASCNSSNGSGSDGGLLTLTGAGWELIADQPIIETIRQSIQRNLEVARLPVKMVDVGRYNTVIDAVSVGRLLSRTIGSATEVDRALGYEANASGTSYLREPAEMLDTYTMGAPMLNVTANRDEVGGVATEWWDDEGVRPHSFPIVTEGVLTGFHLSREGAGWLRPELERRGKSVASNGCMAAEHAGIVPSVRLANLVMHPGAEDLTHRDLEAGLDNGMSIAGFDPDVDFQLLSGYSGGVGCFEIRNGKRVARIAKAGIMFRTPEIWNSILAIGGPRSTVRRGIWSEKGEPSSVSTYSVSGVPMVVKELTFIDAERR